MKKSISKVLGIALLESLGLGISSYGLVTSRLSVAQDQARSEGPEIKIDNFSFMPQDISVTAGTLVTWVNRDDLPHTVTSTNDVFKSKALDTDDKFSYKFDKPGTYEYYCSIHPKMTAKVVVK
jgi:plastocyanin